MPDFALYPAARAWDEAIGTPCPAGTDYLRLTPAQHGTDGFFVALFERKVQELQEQPASFEAPDGAPQDDEGF